eukprot:scaffold752_cov322-Pavlova_lutheri.AAC.32
MRVARARLVTRAVSDGGSLSERRRRAGKRPRPKVNRPVSMPPALEAEEDTWSEDTREAFRRVKQLVPAGQLVPAHLVFAESLRIRDARGDGYEPGEVPKWLKDWLKEAEKDADLAELLRGAENDPREVERRLVAQMRREYEEKFDESLEDDDSDDVVKVQFREVDNFSLWVWWELDDVPGSAEREALEEVVKSWFLLGRLGAFNTMNLQVFEKEEDVSHMKYSQKIAREAPAALFHSMSEFEYNGKWARCWFDLGTADELALDVLINTLNGMLEHMIPIRRVVFGGENSDWKINPKMMQDAIFENNVPYTDDDFNEVLTSGTSAIEESGDIYEMEFGQANKEMDSEDGDYNIEDYL